MKIAKLKNLKEHEVTAIINYILYGININNKLYKIIEYYDYNLDYILEELCY